MTVSDGISHKQSALHLLQVIRGFAAVGVVCYHAGLLLHEKLGTSELGWWVSWGFSGVHIFFVLSGFIICLIHFSDLGQPQRAKLYLYKRFVRIFPVYWVVLLISLFFFTPGEKGFSYYFAVENVSLIRITNHDKIVSVAWTLSHEILFYLVFLLFILSRRVGYFVTTLWVGLIGQFLVTGETPSPPHILARASGLDYGVFTNFIRLVVDPINLLFAIGVVSFFVYRFLSWHSQRERIGVVSLWVGISMMILTCVHWLLNWSSYVGWAGYNAAFGVAAFFFMVGMLSHKADSWSTKHSLLLVLGDASFSIYLVHYGFQKLLVNQFGIPDGLSPSALYLALVLLSVMLGLSFYRIVEAPLLRWFGRGGGRHSMLPSQRRV